MIYTITLNPSIDYIVQVKNMDLGKLNKMTNDLKLPGGKGINVSRILQELDVHSTALGFLGGFTGDFISNWLQKDNISADFIQIQNDTRINIKLKSELETEINGQGPAISTEEADALLKQIGNISSEDSVILSGSKPPSLPDNYYHTLIDVITKSNAAFIIDTTGEDLKAALPYNPLLVKPNLEELEELFETKINTKETILQYGKKLLELGAQHAIVSMAGDGAFLFTKEVIYKGTSPKGVVKNSVGAGDSMIAGFVGEYIKTKDAERAFKMGIASGSATAFSDDLAKRNDILALVDQVKISPV
ncbi:MAG: 1-phosphofructokinase [Oceanobacillus sp.]|nr:1-phosphofructokinase [Oceanobacillus sp.]